MYKFVTAVPYLEGGKHSTLLKASKYARCVNLRLWTRHWKPFFINCTLGCTWNILPYYVNASKKKDGEQISFSEGYFFFKKNSLLIFFKRWLNWNLQLFDSFQNAMLKFYTKVWTELSTGCPKKRMQLVRQNHSFCTKLLKFSL